MFTENSKSAESTASLDSRSISSKESLVMLRMGTPMCF